MKLLLLLVLIGTSLQGYAPKSHPALKDLTPAWVYKSNEPPPARQRQKRGTETNSLKWVTWTGSLPSNAVGIYNDYEERYDYVCKSNCAPGFYSSGQGSYCHIPYGGKEHRYSSFEVLVNVENFEFLKWKGDSYGSVPDNSVSSCSGVYVGKNKYGLGKVDVKNEAFFLPWQGKEYWYKEYEVLTYEPRVESQRITNVKYSIDQKELLTNPPENIRSSSVSNNACRTVTKTVKLSKTVTSQKRWDAGASLTVGVSTSVTAGVPDVASTTTEFSVETTLSLSTGGTWSESKTHTVSVEVPVPPNHSCVVRMSGYKYRMDIPFTATLTRTYPGEETRSRHVIGTYRDMDYGDIRAVVERCKPIANAPPCSKK